MEDFLPKSPETYNNFLTEKTELTESFLREPRPQDQVLRQIILLKRWKSRLFFISLTISAIRKLLHCYRRFQDIGISESNSFTMYKKQKLQNFFCHFPLLLVIFYKARTHALSVYPRCGKNHATITQEFQYANLKAWMAILTLDCQTSKTTPNLLLSPQQPFLEILPLFIQHISIDTKGPIHLHQMQTLRDTLQWTQFHNM